MSLSQSDPVEFVFVQKFSGQITKTGNLKRGKSLVIQVAKDPGLSFEGKIPENWNVLDFMRYYQKLYLEKYRMPFHFNSSAWKQFPGTVKTFMIRHQLTPVEYKRFLDTLFSEICNDRFIPSPGFIVSDKLLQRYRVHASNRKSFPKSDINRFKQAKERLHSRKSSTAITSDKTSL